MFKLDFSCGLLDPEQPTQFLKIETARRATMSHSTYHEAFRFCFVESIRSNVQAPDVVGLVVVNCVGLVGAPKAVDLNLVVADFVDVDQICL